MKTKVSFLIATLVLVSAIVTAMAVTDPTSTPSRPAWENEDGTIDPSKYPPTMEVVDRDGETVGTIDTRHLIEISGSYIPVNGPDGELVGHIGPNGFWKLGEPETVIEGKEMYVEEYEDPDSDEPTNRRRVE
jgi:hypothetical protein